MFKLWQVFEESINYLSEDGRTRSDPPKSGFSCDAIRTACRAMYGLPNLHVINPESDAGKLVNSAEAYLREMGLNPDGFCEFKEFYMDKVEVTQQARALWLTWIAMIAKEEDV